MGMQLAEKYHMSHDLGTVIIFRLSGLGLRLRLGL